MLSIVLAAAAATSSPIPRADCGERQLAVVVQRLQAAAAAPVTLAKAKEFPPPGVLTEDPKYQIVTDASCHDPVVTLIPNYWMMGVAVHTRIATYRYIVKGQIPGENASCAPVYRAALRYAAYNQWHDNVVILSPAYGYTARDVAAVASSSYYGPVRTFWEPMAEFLEFPLERLGSHPPDALRDRYEAAIGAAQARLPKSVTCPALEWFKYPAPKNA